jgi:hypothetical protein
MFPPSIKSGVSMSVSNEFRCNFRLDSLLILLLTSLLTPGGNIPLVRLIAYYCPLYFMNDSSVSAK